MFGIGPMEMIAVLVVALIIFGPQRLPEIGAQVGRALRDFRQMSKDVTDVTGEFQRTMTLDGPPPARTLTPIPVPGQEGSTAGHTKGSNDVADVLGQAPATQTASSKAPGSDLHIEEPPRAGVETGGADGVDGVPVASVATKAAPLAGVALLDAPSATTGVEDDAPGVGEAYVYRPTSIPGAGQPLDISGGSVATIEGDAVRDWSPGTNTPPSAGADTWAAVATTETTASLLVATGSDEQDETAQSVGPAITAPTGDVGDDEESIQAKVEAQLSSSFQERRRHAVYNRARK